MTGFIPFSKALNTTLPHLEFELVVSLSPFYSKMTLMPTMSSVNIFTWVWTGNFFYWSDKSRQFSRKYSNWFQHCCGLDDLGTIPRALTTIDISWSCFTAFWVLARSKYLFTILIFSLWSEVYWDSKIHLKSSFLSLSLPINTTCDLLDRIWWSVCISKSQRIFSVGLIFSKILICAYPIC